jgi:hypothetical protein
MSAALWRATAPLRLSPRVRSVVLPGVSGTVENLGPYTKSPRNPPATAELPAARPVPVTDSTAFLLKLVVTILIAAALSAVMHGRDVGPVTRAVAVQFDEPS